MMYTVLNETIILIIWILDKRGGEKSKNKQRNKPKTNRNRTQEKKSGISFYLKKSR